MAISRRNLLVTGGAAAISAALPPSDASAAPAPTIAVPQRAQGEDLCLLPATVLAMMIRRRQVSPSEVMQAHLRRLDRMNPALNAFVHVCDGDALVAQARAADKRVMQGRARPLEGLPLAVKDLFDFLADTPNTFGSVPVKRKGFAPPFSSGYIQSLLGAGAIAIGKTNTPEFGHKGITDNLAWGPTRTPYNLDFNAGGSSGGSAAAAAAGLAPLTQGSDAGGSVRIPAAMCGVVGYKATFGRIPQDWPPAPHTPFLHPGPITRTVADAALMMDVMGQPSSSDPLSLSERMDYSSAIGQSIKGKRVAFTPDFGLFPVEPEVDRVVRESLDALRDAGAIVEEAPMGLNTLTAFDKTTLRGRPVELGDLSDLWVGLQSVLYTTAVDILRLYVGVDLRQVEDELTPEFRQMIERGLSTSARDYQFGQFLRSDVLHAIEAVFSSYDYIVSPTLSVAGVRNAADGTTVGPASVQGVAVNPLIGWCMTYLYNFTGHPAISVPAGLASNGLPVGVQIAGRRWADQSVLAAAAAVERHRPWSQTYAR